LQPPSRSGSLPQKSRARMKAAPKAERVSPAPDQAWAAKNRERNVPMAAKPTPCSPRARPGRQMRPITRRKGTAPPGMGRVGETGALAAKPSRDRTVTQMPTAAKPVPAAKASPSGAPRAKAPNMAMPTRDMTIPERVGPARAIPQARAPVSSMDSPKPRTIRPAMRTANCQAGATGRTAAAV